MALGKHHHWQLQYGSRPKLCPAPYFQQLTLALMGKCTHGPSVPIEAASAASALQERFSLHDAVISSFSADAAGAASG